MLLIDKYIIKCCDFLKDKSIMWVEGIICTRCKCKKNKDLAKRSL